MGAIRSESHLVRCFRAIDRGDVLPPRLAFPIDVQDVVTWSEGPRTFLVFCETPSAEPRGVVFHRSTGPTPDVAAMCEWCHCVRSHGGVKLLSVHTDDRHSIGLYLCSGISCMERARHIPGPDDVPEGLDSGQRKERVLARILAFANKRLEHDPPLQTV